MSYLSRITPRLSMRPSHCQCSFRALALASVFSLTGNFAAVSFAQDAPIVLPGAPGQAARTLDVSEATNVAASRYTLDDVIFMQNMIPHHAQAVEMAALVKDRTNMEKLIDIAGRIDGSQADEIEFMESWLRERDESVALSGHGEGGHDHHTMAGMASPEQLRELAAADSTDFDRLFLELMIEHHKGAITMVDDLTRQPGSAYDPVLFAFISDIKTDQIGEIKRMNTLLAELSSDPRAGLSAGFEDAEMASMNLKLVGSLPKPAGFFDPTNPSGLPLIKPKKKAADAKTKGDDAKKKAADAKKKASDKAKERGDDGQSLANTEWHNRSPLLSFTNTDMAFSNDILVTGSYHGFNIYRLKDEDMPELLSSVVCPGGQGDVSIVDDLLIMSVEQTRGRVDCGLQGINEDVSEDRFRGIRIFDISDLTKPTQVGQVQTCRGSHTHSVVESNERKIIVYNSGTAGVRDEEELEGCIGNIPGDDRTALFRIDVIEIPVADPSKAKIIDRPTVFADYETGNLSGLWQGGDHGDGTQSSRQTNHCHDITVFPTAKLAAGACSGNGVIFDISNPLKPKRIDEVVDKGFAYWHSATFNNDGTKVVFTDEWGGGSRPRCRAQDPQDWGANAFYDINDGELDFQGYYKMSAPQSDSENCVAHNGSIVPVPGRDIFAQAWYQGGISVVDFSDAANPVEIAFFDRGPVHKERLVLGGYWSTYWYDGKIYGTEIARGLDVMELLPSDYLSANEIAAAKLADQGATFNPQQQFPVSWPADPVIAMAYMDQLERSNSLSAEDKADVEAMLKKAGDMIKSGDKSRDLAHDLRNMAGDLNITSRNASDRKRAAALEEVIMDISRRLR